jgi:double-stranded uracil-DNA glycosylase
MAKKGLQPVVDGNTRILILGSLPSDISIEKGQYYANPGNDFWKIMGSVLDEGLAGRDYADKTRLLLEHHIGLWDVYRSCEREGSMDSNISDVVLNDFDMIKAQYPSVELVCFNGKEAGKSEYLLRDAGFRTQVLPSSSGANRRDQAGRIEMWKSALYSNS